ncbi:MAG: diaminopimelate decarboxylase [Evtepia sp.]|uniref:diaminopimelate decarboxylase n=1 Tax=Evtepia sp. TaxID=2773933 RepID=UPI002A761F3C|nr:diaminopimelate decarboxylase [Evtepia sp.]MDY3015104.1 diaminopimelate decarboxylase [Evtepia sp.]
MLYEHLGVNELGHLTVGGVDTVQLAEEFGAPLYVLDEARLRANCRTYTQAFAAHFPEGSYPLFAGKSLCFKGLYPVLEEEGMGADVVSPGEIYTALAGGFPAQRLYFHGNNKTDEDLIYALESGVGHFIVDNHSELERLNQFAGERDIRQKVLLRVTPGIDPHTLQAINTGRIDCQFGVPIETGQAARFVAAALSMENLEVEGFHSHIGSQIFEAEPFCDAVDILLEFAQEMRQAHGFVVQVLNLGGGFGVRYLESDPVVDIPGNIKALAEHLRQGCQEKDYPLPRVLLEPGRSIVADAGLTLYRVGGIKTIEGYRSYVTVNGGMTDNPRYALYQAPYTVLPADRMNDPRDFVCTVAGRCCESGDLIQENISLPRANRGDLLAVLTTGAYNFTMASNYNRLCRPALVMVRDGKARLAVRRQTFEDLVACDL